MISLILKSITICSEKNHHKRVRKRLPSLDHVLAKIMGDWIKRNDYATVVKQFREKQH